MAAARSLGVTPVGQSRRSRSLPNKKTGVYTLNRGSFDVARYVSLFVMSASIKPIVEAGFVMDAALNARITIFI